MGRQNVWLVNDASTDGSSAFTAALERSGCVIVGSTTFGTLRLVFVVHFRRERRAHN
jgi:C-terminal processing protease CtpA/Prc